jgi:uncharacterized membrane protein YkoI
MYNPRQEVMRRQFCSMAQEFGFASVTDLTLAVEGMTQEERRNTLEAFYQWGEARLITAEVISVKEVMKLEVDGDAETEGDDDAESDVESKEDPRQHRLTVAAHRTFVIYIIHAVDPKLTALGHVVNSRSDATWLDPPAETL